MGSYPVRAHAVEHRRVAARRPRVVGEQPPQTARRRRAGDARGRISGRKRLGRQTRTPNAVRLFAVHNPALLAVRGYGRHRHRGRHRGHPEDEHLDSGRRVPAGVVHGHHGGGDAAHTFYNKHQQAAHAQDAYHTLFHRAHSQLRRRAHPAGRSPVVPALSARRELHVVPLAAARVALYGNGASYDILFHRSLSPRQGAVGGVDRRQNRGVEGSDCRAESTFCICWR